MSFFNSFDAVLFVLLLLFDKMSWLMELHAIFGVITHPYAPRPKIFLCIVVFWLVAIVYITPHIFIFCHPVVRVVLIVWPPTGKRWRTHSWNKVFTNTKITQNMQFYYTSIIQWQAIFVNCSEQHNKQQQKQETNKQTNKHNKQHSILIFDTNRYQTNQNERNQS